LAAQRRAGGPVGWKNVVETQTYGREVPRLARSTAFLVIASASPSSSASAG
jgi:hypothetical protein